MAQISWGQRAARQFEQIQQYLEREFGEKSAGLFTSRLFSFLELLTRYPEIGTLENKEKHIRDSCCIAIQLYFIKKKRT
jgi:plasmid stabilization system protein ParE